MPIQYQYCFQRLEIFGAAPWWAPWTWERGWDWRSRSSSTLWLRCISGIYSETKYGWFWFCTFLILFPVFFSICTRMSATAVSWWQKSQKKRQSTQSWRKLSPRWRNPSLRGWWTGYHWHRRESARWSNILFSILFFAFQVYKIIFLHFRFTKLLSFLVGHTISLQREYLENMETWRNSRHVLFCLFYVISCANLNLLSPLSFLFKD